jgi:BirA family biotin operon repressor/biotin-[acetyl-CoA-carboxylase] ligase
MEIKEFKTIKSTNEKAKELANNGALPWTVIVSEEQESGYGTKGSIWFSPKGGLYFSIILPQNNIQDLQTITILSAFAVAKIIKEIFNLEPMIKLPNDVMINNKKFCGILTENIIIGEKLKLSVIGIGVDTNIDIFPEELKNIATSVKIETNKEVDNKLVLNKIIEEIKNQFKSL